MIQLIPMNALIVSIHAPTRGATISIPSFILGFDSSFNPRTHTGCDATFVGYALIRFRFQSTHPHGVRQFRQRIFKLTETFQSTHPHGVRQERLYSSPPNSSFNPRTHTGCDVLVRDVQHICQVSIHAPTRGATGVSAVCSGNWISFNPRTHTGCDNQKMINIDHAIIVSIHAPTRGATDPDRCQFVA